MAGEGDPKGRARTRARTDARTWPLGGRVAGAAPGWFGLLAPLVQGAGARLSGWIAFDTAPGRLVPWLPIAFGLGVVLYFAADREPFLWAGIAATGLAVALCIATRARQP